MPRSFVISLIICTFLLSCKTYKVEGERIPVAEDLTLNIPYFDSLGKEYLYRANITAYGNNLNGLLVIKKKANSKRVALLSDFGNTLLDIEVSEEKTEVHYIFSDLDRKVIVNKLKKYFELLLKSNYEIDKLVKDDAGYVYISRFQNKRVYIETDGLQNIKKLTQASNFKKKAEIEYFYSETIQADSLHFKSFEIPLEMKFTLMND